MAVSRGFDEFSKRMSIVAKRLERNAEITIQRAAIRADQVIVLATPVDTGRARGNWRVGLGIPQALDEPVSGGGFAAGANAIAEAQQVIASWRLGQGSIFIGNGVPYIVPLDQGSSSQAPNGMVDAGLNAARQEIRRGKLLKGV